jgi:hypothetical protein
MDARRAGVSLLLSLFCLGGCRAIEGLGELTFDLDGGSGVEDCTNGVDDDGDGDVDCADSDCAMTGYSCAAPAPVGWSGPEVLFEQPGATGSTPDCPASYPHLDFVGGASPSGDPATCAPCVCEPPNPTCDATQFQTFSAKMCKGTMTSLDTPSGACVTLGMPASVIVGKAQQGSLDCAVTGGEATIPPLTWASRAVACGGASLGAGCEVGVCAPRPQAPFGQRLCVWQSGDQACPGGYPQKRTLAQVKDDRGCSACGCTTENPPACTVTTTLYSDATCQTAIIDTPAPDTCASLVPAQSVKVDVTSTGGASCAASGGTPTGGVQESVTTFCCDQ